MWGSVGVSQQRLCKKGRKVGETSSFFGVGLFVKESSFRRRYEYSRIART